MIADLNAIEVISLFVEDLPAAREFYLKVFAHEIVFEDSDCTILRIGNIVVNILKVESAHMLVEPGKVAHPSAGARALYTINVKDCDAVCQDLQRLGVPLINGPLDRSWGRRTAAFSDPAGHVWEVAQELPLK